MNSFVSWVSSEPDPSSHPRRRTGDEDPARSCLQSSFACASRFVSEPRLASLAIRLLRNFPAQSAAHSAPLTLSKEIPDDARTKPATTEHLARNNARAIARSIARTPAATAPPEQRGTTPTHGGGAGGLRGPADIGPERTQAGNRRRGCDDECRAVTHKLRYAPYRLVWRR